MSSFGGHMKEYVDISLDRFDGTNLDSTVYFLSHKHEDHMVGLSSTNFVYRLQSNSHIKLYVSDVTRDLLLADDRFTGLAKSLVVHELEVPCSIPVPDPTSGKVKYNVTVTLVPAAHCPGSVMFLLEGREGTVLYTGDFRFARGDLPRFECLKSGSSPKPIDSLYLDTTFCVPEAFYIPSREACVDAIVDVVGRWTALSPSHMVLLYTRANLGYEHLFTKLAEHFNTKIHLSSKKYDQCKRVKAFPDFGTCDGGSTQIHACRWFEKANVRNKSSLPCGHMPSTNAPLHVKRITVSTMWFLQHVGMEEIVVRASKLHRHHLRACYSFHSSYSEVRDMVTYLNPRRVFPNVIPMGHTETEIQNRLDNFLQLVAAGKPPSTPSKPRPLGIQKQPRKRSITASQSTDSDLLFDDSPIKPQKRKKTEGGDGDNLYNHPLSLKWDASQSTIEGNSQPNSQQHSNHVVASDGDMESSYLSSQKSNTSTVDLVASDFDLTPKKLTKNKLESPLNSVEFTEKDKPQDEATVNGVGGENNHSEELFSEDNADMDKEVLSVREAFKPYKEGCYGSHVTYASDIDFSDEEVEQNEVEEKVAGSDRGEEIIGKGNCENKCVNVHNSTTMCQNGQSLPKSNEDNLVVNGEKQLEKLPNQTSDGTLSPDAKDVKDSSKIKKDSKPSSSESSDKSLSIEETGQSPAQNRANQTKSTAIETWPDDDEDDDVIMLDSDEETGEIAGVETESMSEDEDDILAVNSAVNSATPKPSTSKVQEVIDLTAEDDDEGIKIGMRKFIIEEGDGYHGDSESEVNDTDGIMTDSDSSFTKASYEKTKTRMSAGKSRRATIMNGFSSSDSDSDTDLTIDDSLNSTPVRYPIAGSCHYSKTRLNGFYSTLVDNEVIVLDDKEDDPPPNVTVVDIANKDQQANASKSTLASAEDLVSGAMAMASAATAANNSSPRLISTIQRLKKNISKPVLTTASGETSKQTARKSTSAPRFNPKKSPLNKTKISPDQTHTTINGVQDLNLESEDVDPLDATDKVEDISPSHSNNECPVNNDSGKIEKAQEEEQKQTIQDPPVDDGELLR